MAKVRYTAHTHVTGGRDGHAKPPSVGLELDLRVPVEMGGAGGGTNPAATLDVALPSIQDRETAAELVRDAHRV
jgi:organic hydroperoxide reductase OsmC/OhrA